MINGIILGFIIYLIAAYCYLMIKNKLYKHYLPASGPREYMRIQYYCLDVLMPKLSLVEQVMLAPAAAIVIGDDFAYDIYYLIKQQLKKAYKPIPIFNPRIQTLDERFKKLSKTSPFFIEIVMGNHHAIQAILKSNFGAKFISEAGRTSKHSNDPLGSDFLMMSLSIAIWARQGKIFEEILRFPHTLTEENLQDLCSLTALFGYEDMLRVLMHTSARCFARMKVQMNHHLTLEAFAIPLINKVFILAANDGHARLVEMLLNMSGIIITPSFLREQGLYFLGKPLRRGISIDAQFEEQLDPQLDPNHSLDTALHGAATRGHTQTLKLLTLPKRCDLTIRNSDGMTPLMCAANSGSVDSVRLLTTAQALQQDMEAIGDAFEHFGEHKTTEKHGDGILCAKPNHAPYLDLFDDQGMTALMHACSLDPNEKRNLDDPRGPLGPKAILEIVEILIAQGADPNFEAPGFEANKRTALGEAAKRGNGLLVQRLLKCELSFKSILHGLLMAMYHQHMFVVEQLWRRVLNHAEITSDCKVFILLASVISHLPEQASSIITTLDDFSPEREAHDGFNFIILAVLHSLEIPPAELEIPPAEIAKKKQALEVIQILCKHNPKAINAGTTRETSLDRFGKTKHILSTQKSLLPMRTTALMIASAAGEHDEAALLLSFGADPNQQRSDGKTALMLAAMGKTNEHKQVLDSLIYQIREDRTGYQCTADITLLCHKHKNAMYYALENSQAMAEFLLAVGYLLSSEHLGKTNLDYCNALCKATIMATVIWELGFTVGDRDSILIETAKFDSSILPGDIKRIRKTIRMSKDDFKALMRVWLPQPIPLADHFFDPKQRLPLQKLLWEHCSERKQYEYEAFEKQIIDFPERFNEAFQSYYMEMVFDSIETKKQEVQKALDDLLGYINEIKPETQSQERRKKTKLKDHAAQQEKFKTLLKPILNPKSYLEKRAVFDDYYNAQHLNILKAYEAGDRKKALDLKQPLDNLLLEVEPSKQAYLARNRDLLELKIKLHALIREYQVAQQKREETIDATREPEFPEESTEQKSRREAQEKVDADRNQKLADDRARQRAAWMAEKKARADKKAETERKTREDSALSQKPLAGPGAAATASSRSGSPPKTPPAGVGIPNTFAQFLPFFSSGVERSRKIRPASNSPFDLLPSLQSETQEFASLEAILEVLKLPDSGDRKTSIEDIRILRYALLGTLARVMEHTKNLQGAGGFPAQLAKKFRDTIFHANNLLPDLDVKSIREGQEINLAILDMTRKIIACFKERKKSVSNQGQRGRVAQKPFEQAVDSPLFKQIIEHPDLRDLDLTGCTQALATGEKELAELNAYQRANNSPETEPLITAAFGYLYGRLGTLASCLLKIASSNSADALAARAAFDTKAARYREFIRRGIDYRHGGSFHLDTLATPAYMAAAADAHGPRAF